MKDQFFALLKQAENAAFADNDFERAVELCGEAEDFAHQHHDPELADRAFCNRCAYLIELDQADQQIPRLKEIILRSSDQRTRWMATFYTAQVYFLAEDVDRAWSYADRASALARELGDVDTIAHSTNLAGTLSLRRSCFDDAEGCYSGALARFEELDGYHGVYRSLAKDNLGYVMMCTDRVEDGIRFCEEARIELEEQDAEFALHEVFQDLCYGHILADNLERAEECGDRALSLAMKRSDNLIVKNSLFLLAEIAVRRGDTFRARRYLRELTEYYPEVGVSDEIIDVFLTTDLTQVVNLRG